MGMQRLNINEMIKVKLTDKGKDLYYHRYDYMNDLYGKTVITPKYPKVDENGLTEFQLWDFMSLYGPHMINGIDLVIDKNNIYISDKLLEDCDERSIV